MNAILKKTLFLLPILTLLISCKSADPMVRQQQVDEIAEKLDAQNYVFEAQSALPMSAKIVHLTSTYTLKVRPDTITAYLPYFGRAYSVSNPTEGGIKFESTNFKYEMSEKKKGVSRVSIEINDNPNKYKLSLLIGELGNTTLYVEQINKQAISFTGNIY